MTAQPVRTISTFGIIPVHNRRETALACLRHLDAINALRWIQVCVIDDSSTDGTSDAIRAEFPSVTLLPGDGTLWWTGSIALGMRHALERKPAALFWLNDDCLPAPGALERLLTAALAGPCITVAQVEGACGIHHGGLRRRWNGLELVKCASGDVLPVDTMNGDCVCLPRELIAKFGHPDAATFPQAWGDTDYGLRARRAGIDIRVVGEAHCLEASPSDPEQSSWLRGERSMREVARSFRTPKNYFHPPSWWHFNIRHWGAWGAVLFIVPYLRFAAIAVVRAIIPLNLRRHWFGAARR